MTQIKSIKTQLVVINPYDEVLADFVLSEKDYNKNGHLLTEAVFDDQGEIESKRVFEVDDNGQILVQINYERKNDLVERTEYFDDEDSFQYRTEITTSAGAKSIYEYQYNQLGNAERIIVKNEEGEIERYEVFVFDENHRVEEEVILNPENEIEFRKIISYDDAGSIVNENFYDRNHLTRTIEHFYNESGQVEQTVTTDLQSDIKTINRYTYDNYGNQVLDETSRNGQVTFKNYCLYDEQNNLIEERVMSLAENTIEIFQHQITYW